MNKVISSILTLIIYFLTQQATAQVVNQNQQVTESLLIDKFNVGLNSKILIPTDSLITSNDVSLRTGVLLTKNISNTLSIESAGAIQLNSNNVNNSFTSFEFITQLNGKMQFRIGALVTPTTKLRPNPITWQSQSETYTQSRIIGGRPGATLDYKPAKDVYLAYGIHNHRGIWANHLRMDYKKFKVSGYVQNNEDYFIALNYQSKKVWIFTNYSSQFEEFAGNVFVNITDRYTVYTDANYLFDIRDTDVTRFGIRSYFENRDWHIKGFLALEYDYSAELIAVQLFIHLI